MTKTQMATFTITSAPVTRADSRMPSDGDDGEDDDDERRRRR